MIEEGKPKELLSETQNSRNNWSKRSTEVAEQSNSSPPKQSSLK